MVARVGVYWILGLALVACAFLLVLFVYVVSLCLQLVVSSAARDVYCFSVCACVVWMSSFIELPFRELAQMASHDAPAICSKTFSQYPGSDGLVGQAWG